MSKFLDRVIDILSKPQTPRLRNGEVLLLQEAGAFGSLNRSRMGILTLTDQRLCFTRGVSPTIVPMPWTHWREAIETTEIVQVSPPSASTDRLQPFGTIRLMLGERGAYVVSVARSSLWYEELQKVVSRIDNAGSTRSP